MIKLNKNNISRLLCSSCVGVGSLLTAVQPQAVQQLPALPPLALANNARTPDKPAVPAATARLAQLGTQWLNQFGQAEIMLTDSRPESLLRGARLALLLPCHQQAQQLLFTQWGIQRADHNTTLNLGMGQRWLTASPGYWGYNLFYDYRFKGHHQRLGIGLERRSNTLALAVNGYLPLSAERIVDNNAHKVRPARGVDIRLQHTPESQPHWRFNLIGERYFGNQVVPVDQQPKRHPAAVTVGLDYTPLPLVTTGYGFKLASGGQRSHQLQLNINYHLGVPLVQQLDPQQVAASRSLAGSHLALVQRNAQVILQQRPNDASPLRLPRAQQPDDAIQLQLPHEQRGKINQRITFNIVLSTTQPRDEWTLRWESNLPGRGAVPHINAAKDSATLTLPACPGSYQLQLIARNTRNGAVVHSNEMLVQVEALTVPINAPRPANSQDNGGDNNGGNGVIDNNGSSNVGDNISALNSSPDIDTAENDNQTPEASGEESFGSANSISLASKSGSTMGSESSGHKKSNKMKSILKGTRNLFSKNSKHLNKGNRDNSNDNLNDNSNDNLNGNSDEHEDDD